MLSYPGQAGLRQLSEDAFSKASCRELGYLRICGEVAENILPEIAVSKYLQRIAECLDLDRCTKGFPLSGNGGRIIGAGTEKFLSLFSQKVGISFETAKGSKGYLLLQETSGLEGLLLQKIEDLGRQVELVSWKGGVYLGIKVNEELIIIPRVNAQKESNELTKLFQLNYAKIFHMIPYIAFYAYHILKAYRKLMYSVEIVPKFTSLCRSKGEKLECYKYRGSSRCPFVDGVLCPLRTIHRKSTTEDLGGVLNWIEPVEASLEKGKERVIYGTDYFVSAYLSKYLAGIAYALSSALKETAQLSSYMEDEELALRKATEIRGLSNATGNYKLKELVHSTSKEIEDLVRMTPPQRRTRIIISLDGFPNRLRLISKMAENDRIYTLCSPKQVSAAVIEGYINTFFPLLKGELSKIASEKISALLAINGCVEAKDLSSIFSEELAENLLNLLHSKNLLSKRRGGTSNIYL